MEANLIRFPVLPLAEEEEKQQEQQYTTCMEGCVPKATETRIQACETQCRTDKDTDACLTRCIPKDAANTVAACNTRCEPPRPKEEVEGNCLEQLFSDGAIIFFIIRHVCKSRGGQVTLRKRRRYFSSVTG
jgi:hypothetical protein